MGLKDLLGADDVVGKKKDSSGGHKYADEAEAILEAIEAKDKDGLAEALKIFFSQCDMDADEELDDDE